MVDPTSISSGGRIDPSQAVQGVERLDTFIQTIVEIKPPGEVRTLIENLQQAKNHEFPKLKEIEEKE